MWEHRWIGLSIEGAIEIEHRIGHQHERSLFGSRSEFFHLRGLFGEFGNGIGVQAQQGISDSVRRFLKGQPLVALPDLCG